MARLFSDEPLPAASAPIDILTARMLEKMAYEPGERDMLVLHTPVPGRVPGPQGSLTSTLVDFGIPNGDTSMARTVGLPAAIAVRMILHGQIP